MVDQCMVQLQVGALVDLKHMVLLDIQVQVRHQAKQVLKDKHLHEDKYCNTEVKKRM